MEQEEKVAKATETQEISAETEAEARQSQKIKLIDEGQDAVVVQIEVAINNRMEKETREIKDNNEAVTKCVAVEKTEKQLLEAVLNQKSIAITNSRGEEETSTKQEQLVVEVAETATDDAKPTSPNHSIGSSESSPDRELGIIAKSSSPSISSMRFSELAEEASAVETSVQDTLSYHVECLAQQEEQRAHYEQQVEQLRAALAQKDNMILLFQRENAILEKEKQAFRKEKEFANKEKETTVIKFAMKEKLLIDAKKEKDAVEKQLADAKKEIKNVSLRFQAINEEKSRITYIMDEKCNELRKYQRECEKLKTDYSHLESKLKYHVNKLNLEIEAKMALEKKLEEERNAPNKMEEKANEKLKVEYEANSILLKHELERKMEIIDNLTKENQKSSDFVKQLQEQLGQEIAEKTQFAADMQLLREEHTAVQNAYSTEMLNSAKLRGQLDELLVLRTQNTLNEEKIFTLTSNVQELEEKLLDNVQDLQQLHSKEEELLSINKEMSESIVGLQNETCLLKAKAQGIEAENEIFKKEKFIYDTQYETLKKQLKDEEAQKTEERQLLAKHLSEKTKLYETTKMKLSNVLGDFEATKNKHVTVVKELQREIQKYKRSLEQASSHSAPNASGGNYCSSCQNGINGYASEQSDASTENGSQRRGTHSRSNSSQSGQNSRRASASSESETVVSSSTAVQNDLQGPSKKHLVDRILRLQQASARQTEKIDFLENHTLSLVAELQKKSKVVQHYMLRDQAGALTSSKSDQNKSELAKYGNGVMSAIYSGIKGGENKSMTLELSLEINKKLQAVLEDTLLKNITLKENLDVLGIEVDNLTRKLRKLELKE